MHRRRVLDDDHVVALRAAEAEFGDRRGAVGEQTAPVLGVDPRARDDLGAVQRTEVVLEVRDELVEQVGVEHALLREHRLDRGDARFDRRERLGW